MNKIILIIYMKKTVVPISHVNELFRTMTFSMNQTGKYRS